MKHIVDDAKIEITGTIENCGRYELKKLMEDLTNTMCLDTVNITIVGRVVEEEEKEESSQ